MIKQSPRIYLYKITFEEVPYFYYGIHSEKKYGESYIGSPIKHKWAWKFYTSKKQILQLFDSMEEAASIEQKIIKYFMGKDPNCLNACAGRAFLNGKGEKNHCYGKFWWNNGKRNERSETCPGEDWVRGKIHRSFNHKIGKNHHSYGKKWWNNGRTEIFCKTKPDGSWFSGRIKRDLPLLRGKPLTPAHKKNLSKALKGKMVGDKNPMSKKNYSYSEQHRQRLGNNSKGRKWWNNGIENKFQRAKPGLEWIKGMITKQKIKNA